MLKFFHIRLYDGPMMVPSFVGVQYIFKRTPLFFRILGRRLPEEDGRLGASLSMRFRLDSQQANNAKEMAQAWPGAHGSGGVVVTKLDKRPLNNQEQNDQAGTCDSGELERYVRSGS